MTHISKKRWVIVFLIYADFRLDRDDISSQAFAMTAEMKAALDIMLNDILTTPLNPAVARLFVIMNGINYQKSDGNEPIKTENLTIFCPIVDSGNSYCNKLGVPDVVYRIVNETTEPQDGKLQRTDTLKNILTKNISLLDDEEVLLVTWDHGSAFGIFREVTPRRAEPLSSIYNDLDRYPYLKYFWNHAIAQGSLSQEFSDKEELNTATPILKIGNDFYLATSAPAFTPLLPNLLSKPITIGKESRNEIKNGILRAPILFHDKKEDRLFIASESDENDPNNHEIIALLNEVKGPEILSNDELAEVIHYWLKGRKLADLLMMNCWMMNLHSMYSFRESVHCLVAPQGYIGSPGYNYKEILLFIYNNAFKGISPQELARQCVETCENENAKKRAAELRKDKPNIIDSWKIFAADLQAVDKHGKKLLSLQIEALKNLIDVLIRFPDEITERPEPNKYEEAKWMFKYVRSATFDFSEYDCPLVDIVNWSMSILSAQWPFEVNSNFIIDDGVKKALTEFRISCLLDGKDKVMLLSTKGPAIYTINNTTPQPYAVTNLEPKGYSLFFPLFKLDPEIARKYANVLANVNNDPLLNGPLKNWKKFLEKHIDDQINL